jgi:two-component system response regulator DesR
MLSVLILEDHDIMAEVLIRLIQRRKDMNVVTRVKTAEHALELLSQEKVDLIMVDISLPQMDGIQFVSILNKTHPHLLCLMLSGHEGAHYVRRSLEAGARGYLLKDDPIAIMEGIDRILAGEIYVSKNFQLTANIANHH